MTEQLAADPVFGPLSEAYPSAIGRDGRPEEIAATDRFLLSDAASLDRRVGALRRRRHRRDPAPDLARGLGRRPGRADLRSECPPNRTRRADGCSTVDWGAPASSRSPARACARRPDARAGRAAAAARHSDPRLTRKIYVSKKSQAFRRRQARPPRSDPIGRQPIGAVVSENWFPMRTVRKQVRKYAKKANRARPGRRPRDLRDPGPRLRRLLRPVGSTTAAYKKWVTQDRGRPRAAGTRW